MLTKQQPSERIEALDFYYLIGIHLKTIILKLGEGLAPGGTINSEKLISFYMLTKHYENMITMFLDENYWEKKKAIVENIPPIDATWADVKSNLKFFNQVSKWFQLIHVCAYNQGILKIQRPYTVDNTLEAYVDGYTPPRDY